MIAAWPMGTAFLKLFCLMIRNYPLIKRHLARLEKGAMVDLIYLSNLELIDKYLNLFVDQLKAQSITHGVVKVIVTAGQGGRGYQSPP